MKNFITILIGLLFSFGAFAQRADPLCGEFRYIQRTMKAIDAKSVDRVLPNVDWLDVRYRREDRIAAGSLVARTVVLLLLQKLTFVSYLFVPSRAEAATVTGSYVRNPQAFLRFLQLPPERACFVLGLGGSDGELLREATHEVYREFRRASR